MGEPLLDLYYAPTPNGWKITIALEEMGLPYNVVPVDLLRGDQFSDDFLKISPNGRMPALIDRSTHPPVTVFESGAILIYLAQKTGLFYPKTPADHTCTLEWLFWQAGGLGPMAGQLSHFVNYASVISPNTDHSYSLNRYRAEYRRLLGVMEKQLEKHSHLATEEYTVADMAAYPWVVPAKRFGIKLEQEFPRTSKWAKMLAKRPAVHKGLRVQKETTRDVKKADPEQLQKLFNVTPKL